MAVCSFSSGQAAEIEVSFLGLFYHCLVLLCKRSVQEWELWLRCSCGFMCIFNACIISVQ